MLYRVLQVRGGNKDSGQMIVPLKNTICTPGLERGRSASPFKNLARCAYHACGLGETVLPAGRMIWGMICQPETSIILSFLSEVGVPLLVEDASIVLAHSRTIGSK